MGDPRRLKKKYFPPRHPWIKERIDSERELTREYALKTKKEIYKLDSILKKFKDQAKKLIAATTKQAEKEKKQMMQRLQKLALIQSEAALDDVLGLTLKDIMERRLQNLVFKKGLARTQAQSRQFIVHEHIMIGNKKITAPNYLVSQAEEELITFSPPSKLANAEHPERSLPEKVEKLPVRPAPKEVEKEVKEKNETKKKAKPKKKKEVPKTKPEEKPKEK
jgi:small subunit ribosomal protein S4